MLYDHRGEKVIALLEFADKIYTTFGSHNSLEKEHMVLEIFSALHRFTPPEIELIFEELKKLWPAEPYQVNAGTFVIQSIPSFARNVTDFLEFQYRTKIGQKHNLFFNSLLFVLIESGNVNNISSYLSSLFIYKCINKWAIMKKKVRTSF